jgi:hypothetical protein
MKIRHHGTCIMVTILMTNQPAHREDGGEGGSTLTLETGSQPLPIYMRILKFCIMWSSYVAYTLFAIDFTTETNRNVFHIEMPSLDYQNGRRS